MIQDAEGYKARVIGSAKGDAARFTSVLGEYLKSPDVMRDRLYLDTFENIMKQASKVLVDVDGGNNMLYLPLDHMTKSAGSSKIGRASCRERGEVASTLAVG